MKTFKTNNPFPIYCLDCREVRSTNLAASGTHLCGHCGGLYVLLFGKETRWPIAQPSLLERKTDSDWHEGRHICPSCDDPALVFSHIRFFYD